MGCAGVSLVLLVISIPIMHVFGGLGGDIVLQLGLGAVTGVSAIAAAFAVSRGNKDES